MDTYSESYKSGIKVADDAILYVAQMQIFSCAIQAFKFSLSNLNPETKHTTVLNASFVVQYNSIMGLIYQGICVIMQFAHFFGESKIKL